jgi:AraC-like DNA-binding protein
MQGATVATTSSRALLSACERIGIDTRELLAAANLTAAEVDDPDGRLPGEAVAALWQAALERSGDPELGLRVALAVPFGVYRLIDFLAASAATVGEGLLRVARYFPLINSALGWQVSEMGGKPGAALARRMALTYPAPAGRLPRPYAEYAVAVTVLHCRRASGFDWPVVEVAFEFGPPSSTADHVNAFGCPVLFDQPYTGFALAQTTWDTPSRAASSDLLRTLEEHADRLIAGLRAGSVVSAKVSRLIAEELQGGDASLRRIARRMGMSPRTLQRRLEEEDTSFADVVDRTRRDFAEVYIKEEGLALTEVAYLLGFSEPSAFTRAFHRWYGVPPSQFRSRQPAA